MKSVISLPIPTTNFIVLGTEFGTQFVAKRNNTLHNVKVQPTKVQNRIDVSAEFSVSYKRLPFAQGLRRLVPAERTYIDNHPRLHPNRSRSQPICQVRKNHGTIWLKFQCMTGIRIADRSKIIASESSDSCSRFRVVDNSVATSQHQ